MIIQRKTKILMALMVMNVFLFQSCMTIMRGTSQKIPVTSNPSGAKIIIDGEEIGYAPLNLKLKRKKSHNIRIEKEGYDPFTVIITRKASIFPSLLRNFFVGGFLGAWLEYAFFAENRSGLGLFFGWGAAIAFDFITGANYTLSPKELNVTLSKIEGKPHPNIILIDAEHFQNIKWIRIKCADSVGKDEIVNLD